MENKDNYKKILKKFNITEEQIKKLKEEQKKLSKLIKIKDSTNFDLVEIYAGIENIFKGNRIISAIVLMKDKEIIEQKYITEKVNFPYIPGLRAYRELPSMIKVFNMLEERPDVIFVRASGIAHERGLGLASHFSLSVNVPTIGITDNLLIGEIKGNDIIINKKIVGKVLKLKKEANPIYVSPGNLISISAAEKLTIKFTTPPHKFPDPLIEARKYAKKLLRELFLN
ncbi:MAG: endonuclease V [Candidatus Pacearchaeota archaeon]